MGASVISGPCTATSDPSQVTAVSALASATESANRQALWTPASAEGGGLARPAASRSCSIREVSPSVVLAPQEGELPHALMLGLDRCGERCGHDPNFGLLASRPRTHEAIVTAASELLSEQGWQR
jgi:hypothetical protein